MDRWKITLVAGLASCGPAVGDGDDGSEMPSSEAGETEVEEGPDADSDPVTGGASADGTTATATTNAETSGTGGETGGETGGTTADTGADPPEFDDGEDDCLGPEGGGGPQGCSALAAAQLLDVIVEDDSGDGVWTAGETLRVTLNYAAGDEDINAPAIVAQVDLASRDYVTVPWIWWEWFYVFAGEQVAYEVTFTAEPDVPAGTDVALRLGLASNNGNLTQCDCPDVEIDAWTESLTID